MRSLFKNLIIYIFLFELLFQILILLDFRFIKIPDLFYNPYCEEKYWKFNKTRIIFKNEIKYHPILSYVKKNLNIPENLNTPFFNKKKLTENNQLIFYGSSYINHAEFKSLFSNFKKKDIKNYALDSYGLDQIFLSYKLTAHFYENQTIVIGFLLEDLDRSLLKKRDYEKVMFKKKLNDYDITNVPIQLENREKFKTDFYFYKFIKNFLTLISNNFDPRQDKCLIKDKIELLNYFIKEISLISKKYNQKIVIVTFNLKEDFLKIPSWRYKVIKQLISEQNIQHVDALSVLKKQLDLNYKNIQDFFGADRHNNSESFKFIVDEIIKFL